LADAFIIVTSARSSFEAMRLCGDLGTCIGLYWYKDK
jgi:hypothetical protein